MRKTIASTLAAGVLLSGIAFAQPSRPVGPGGQPGGAAAPTGLDPARLQKVDDLITAAIAAKETPGAVLLVGHRGRIVYRKAYGHRAVSPSVEAMTLDTIFDMASVTKPVATATSVMILIEEGRIRLSDRVAAYIPEFASHGKGAITIRHLLTHVSGLRPDLDLADPWVGSDTAITLASDEIPLATPGERFVYSDINFFLLGDIVRRVSGMTLDQFARARIFEPIGMKETGFNPPEAVRGRIAPTERCTPYGWPCEGPDMQMLRGVVHDPTARRMGGVAGHAGLFSTAADLAIFCRMLLGGGAAGGARILSPLSVAKMTSPAGAPGDRHVRGLGWDIDSAYSSNRGELFPIGSFGHTGFTGTSLWIDPATETFVVFLSNRLHPDGKGDVTPLRARVATAVAAAITDPPAQGRRPAVMTGADFGASGPAPSRAPDRVLTGIDVLRAEGFARLAGRRVGLVTNHTGIARDGVSTIDLFYAAKNLTLVALFSPEHGIRGVLDEDVPVEKDEKTGLIIHSLYGATRRPTDEMLTGIDTLVVDLQDIGARFYTYIATMAYVMEEAAKRGLKVVVLDRPNPVGGSLIEGPMADADRLSFVAYFQMPIRHGMTLGEMAKLFNVENKIGADLTVVEMRGWRRDMWFDETGLPWVNPSPNMRNMIAAEVYTGVGMIEGANISVGRGTDTPFEQIGAPWMDGVQLADALNLRRIPGVRFYPIRFTPSSSKHAKQACQGVFILVTDRSALRPVRLGAEIASALLRLYGDQFKLADSLVLIGSRADLTRLLAGDDPAQVAAGWAAGEAKWRLLRAKYAIYR